MKSLEITQPHKKKKLPDYSKNFSNMQRDSDAHLNEAQGITGYQYEALFNNLPHSMVLYRILYGDTGKPIDFFAIEVNKAFEQSFSLKKEDILFERATENFPLKISGSRNLLKIFGKVAITGKPAQFVAHSKTKNCYQVYVYRVMEGYCVSVFVDVTAQRKKAAEEMLNLRKTQQQLISSEKRFRRLYETTQDGIMARDLQGRMLHCNPAYAKMLGYARKELKLLSVKALMPERWHTQRDRVAQKVLKTGRSIVFEREYKRKDGSIFPASVRSWPLTDGKGRVIGIWSIVRDISQQKKHQKTLEKHAGALEKIVVDRTKQLKDSERLAAIGQTAGMVGHDLRNPLQTITGELYLAKTEVEAFLDSQTKRNLQENLQIIEEQATYMDKIVSDLQAFVQPVTIDKKAVHLQNLIDNVLRTVSLPPDTSVKMQCQHIFPQVNADPNLLKRVLINLVTNAAQAMPNGGELTINSQVNNDRVCISVTDTGVGIADSIKSNIFTPLFTTKPRGQGFGLAVCKRVIEAHGGTITFKSTEGKGTQFIIQFPIN